jgi:molybdate transport system substrate-binding protein
VIPFALIGLLSACLLPPAVTSTDAPQRAELVVFAAASLTEAFDELGANFERANPGLSILFNFGGSQQLAQQLGQGAPADLFASANARQMEAAIEVGRVMSGTERIFVRNRLVVVYPSDNPAALTTLADLARPGIRLILAAQEVPVGAYSLDFLERASADPDFGPAYSAAVLSNVVSYEQNVRAVLSKVLLGEADAGIVYTSDITRDAGEQVGRIDIPDALNTVAAYPIAPVVDAAQAELAQAFIDYVLSSEGQATLQAYGFLPAGTQ